MPRLPPALRWDGKLSSGTEALTGMSDSNESGLRPREAHAGGGGWHAAQ